MKSTCGGAVSLRGGVPMSWIFVKVWGQPIRTLTMRSSKAINIQTVEKLPARIKRCNLEIFLSHCPNNREICGCESQPRQNYRTCRFFTAALAVFPGRILGTD